ncbi:ATP-binding cassette domain-containing protein [Kitasatospora sp. NPDC087315]|uniref:ATP-binding cassette domain-containing protein n=1 Tax=Kitasatospora sp. NPDC087315 TaxID=3364069 RepID=UPI00381BEC9F
MTPGHRNPAASVRTRAARWVAIARLLPAAGGPLVTLALAVNLALGLLPVAFMVATAVAISRLPRAAAAGGAWGVVLPALLVGLSAFVVAQTLRPFQTAVAESVTRAVDGYCVDRLLTATTIDAPPSSLDRPEALDRLADARSAFDRAMPSPGDAVAGLVGLVARYAQLAAALVVLAVVLRPWAAVLAAVTAIAVRFGQRGSLAAFVEYWKGMAGERRKSAYLRTAAIEASGGKEIRLLGALPWFRDRYRAEAVGYLAQLWKERRRLLLLPFVGLAAVAAVGGGGVFLALATGVPRGTDGALALALTVQCLLVPLRFGVYFPESDVQTQYGMLAYRALTDFEAQTGHEARPERARPVPRLSEGIAFRKVSFGYPGADRRVYEELDLLLPANRSTAVIGLNGAGKTTLVKLLARVHEPGSGRIEADGVPLTDLEPAEWRRRLAVVFQDFNRYDLTLAENVALGAAHRPMDRDAVTAALVRAGAREILDAVGPDTALSAAYQGGRDLSGGQWQRVALARALYAVDAGAEVLVLDEPTAQLDIRAEVAFYDRFLELTRGITSVVISHRFSTVRRADNIVVIEDGAVIENGDHDSLLRAGGRYAELFRLQADRFDRAPDDPQADSTGDGRPDETAPDRQGALR